MTDIAHQRALLLKTLRDVRNKALSAKLFVGYGNAARGELQDIIDSINTVMDSCKLPQPKKDSYGNHNGNMESQNRIV